jgi:peptidoglycan/LPS O-acetylase OafA/YrhL
VHKSASAQLSRSSIPDRRIRELDGIRGFAILAVLLYHLFSYSMFRQSWTGLAHVAMKLTEHLSHGVDLFFVLSGFLITGILVDSRSDPKFFRNFYARRALRILPLYYVVLAVILLCYRHSGSYVLLSFAHLSNMAPVLGITMVNGAMWSLSVEEHFYLCWPFVVRQFRRTTVAKIAAAICFAEPVIRAVSFSYVASVFPYSWFRLDGIALGAWLACYVRSKRYSQWNAQALALGFAAAGLCVEIFASPFGIRQYHTRFGAAFEFPPINLICAAIVLWGAARSGAPQTRLLRSRLLRICGDLSYCLYLSHCMVMDGYDAAYRALYRSSPVADFRSVLIRAAIVLLVSFAIAAVSRVVVELPALRARRFFLPPAERAEDIATAA